MRIKINVPNYYTSFSCIMDKCVNNCCKGGWLVEVDSKTVEKYRQMEDRTLYDSLFLDEEGDYCFKSECGRCPHLDEEGFCNIHKNMGEEALSTVCREFPRFTNDYGIFREMGIGLGCEEAARIILNNDKKVELVTLKEENIENTSGNDVEEDYAATVIDIRNWILEELYVEAKDINAKIIKILCCIEEMQECINEGDYEAVRVLIQKNKAVKHRIKPSEDRMKEGNELLYDIYSKLETLYEGFDESLRKAYKMILEEKQFDVYKFKQFKNLSYNIISYYVFRYMIKGVEDYNISDKFRFCVINYIIISAVLSDLTSDLAQNDKVMEKESSIIDEKIIDTVRIYSRQVEYSEENIETILEELDFGDELNYEVIAGMLEK